jgi:hypothetical protein
MPRKHPLSEVSRQRIHDEKRVRDPALGCSVISQMTCAPNRLGTYALANETGCRERSFTRRTARA